MKPTIELVREFHERMGQPVLTSPGIPNRERIWLRLELIAEEFRELCEASGYVCDVAVYTPLVQKPNPDHSGVRYFVGEHGDVNLVEVADALADLDYVIAGTALEFGIPHTAVVAEVHRSNMTKEPGHVRSDGKILKGPNYSPPDIAAVLEGASRPRIEEHSSDCDRWSGEACSREPGCAVPPGIDYQPRPTTGDAEVWPLVLKDIEARRAFGMAKYGVPLRTNDDRKSLVDAYQEALDLVVYLRKEIEERAEAPDRTRRG